MEEKNMENEKDFKVFTEEELFNLEKLLNAIDDKDEIFIEAKEQIKKVKEKIDTN